MATHTVHRGHPAEGVVQIEVGDQPPAAQVELRAVHGALADRIEPGIRLEARPGRHGQAELVGRHVADPQERMRADRIGGAVRSDVGHPVDDEDAVVHEFVPHRRVEHERVSAGRMHRRGQRHGMRSAVKHGVRAVPQQPVQGIVTRGFGDVEQLSRVLVGPSAVFDPIGPRHEHDAVTERGYDVLAVGLGQVDPADREHAKGCRHLGDHREGLTVRRGLRECELDSGGGTHGASLASRT